MEKRLSTDHVEPAGLCPPHDIAPVEEMEKTALKAADEKAMVTSTVAEVTTSHAAEIRRPSRTKLYIWTAKTKLWQTGMVLAKFGRFMGPGAIISVAYIDPDNYQTAITAGTEFKYKLLFIILISNVIAIFLQALSVKLGSVTGLDLAQMNRAHMPRWMNISFYILAEAAIVCTDVSAVIGMSIAINILVPKIPIVAGCALSIADTLFILLFYRPDRSLRGLRVFEYFVAAFVIGVFACFCIELSDMDHTTARAVFDGFVPSSAIVSTQGLYQSCAILGGTLMPHTIYLGTGLVQARMRHFDVKHDHYREAPASAFSLVNMEAIYRPSLSAIRSCMSYSIAELCITLFVVAIFVNSAILIVAATSLSEAAGDASLWGLYDLFVSSISQAAGTIFGLALLFSGISAGVVGTMAGQMICEGALNWRMSPFLRRLATRSLAIIPAIVIASIEGKPGLAAALNGCNVVLSVALIFVTAPLIWYTSFNKYMTVIVDDADGDEAAVDVPDAEGNDPVDERQRVSLANNWATTIVGVLIWALLAFMNVATLVLLGLNLSS